MDRVEELIFALHQEREEAEIELIGTILVDPAEGVYCARREGLKEWMIEADGLRLIYMAAARYGKKGRAAVLEEATRLLKKNRLWDETMVGYIPTRDCWNGPSLERLADSQVSAWHAFLYAKRIVGIWSRLKEAERLGRRLREVLEGRELVVMSKGKRVEKWKRKGGGRIEIDIGGGRTRMTKSE